jgi:hypothetical protein
MRGPDGQAPGIEGFVHCTNFHFSGRVQYYSRSQFKPTRDESMRPFSVASFVFVAGFAAGCAGTPSSPPPPATAPTTYISATGAPVAQVSAKSPTGDLDTKKLVDAKKSGFTVINQDGVELLCKSEAKTGSRITRDSDTTCLTAKQWDDMRTQTQQGVQNYIHTNGTAGGK